MPLLRTATRGGSVTGLHYVFKPRLVVGTEYKVEYYQPPGAASGDPPGLLYLDIDRHGVRIAVRCGTGDSLVLAALVACMPLCRHSHAESALLCSLIPSSPRQTGTIGVFDVPTLLMALVSSVALLAVAKTVVEVMAFHILPLKSVYRWGQPPHSALPCAGLGAHNPACGPVLQAVQEHRHTGLQ